MSQWISIPLSDKRCFEYLNGLWKGKTPPFETAVVIRNTNFRNDGILELSDVAMLDVESRQLEGRRLKKGDIIIERSGGGPKQPVGRVCYFNIEDSRPHSFSNFTTTLRVKDTEAFVPLFVHYYLLQLYYAGFTVPLQRATTGIRNLDFAAYLQAEVPRPPKSEQEKIATVLWKIQRAIELEEKLIATTRELKHSAMVHLFTRGLRGEPQKETGLGSIPKSWSIDTFGSVASLFNGFAFKSTDAVSHSKTQLIRMGNLYQNKLDLTRSPIFYPDSMQSSYQRFLLKPGDMIMSLTGTMGKEDYGFVVCIPDGLNKSLLLNQRVAKIVIHQNAEIDPNFFFQFLLSRLFLDKLYPTAKGTKQANLSSEIIKGLQVLKPRLSEQVEIAQILQTIDLKVSIHERKRAALQELFRTLLYQLMIGQIPVHELDIDVSEIQ